MVLLTPMEKANKALAYRLLEKKQVHIKDMGDMMILSPAGQPNNAPHKLQLHMQPDEVESEIIQVIEYARQ
jgi:virulence-associated protein VagC